MRASAFTYLYRTLEQGVDEADARADMEKIWDPDAYRTDQWARFIDEARKRYEDR